MSLAGALILLASLVVSTAILLTVVVVVWYLDRYDREPLHMVAAVFLWGAAAAPFLSVLIFNSLDRLLHGPAAVVSAFVATAVATPLVEEIAKAIGVMLVVWFTRDFDNPTDGFVYGTAVGLGFAVTENYLYGVGAGSANTVGSTELVVFTGGRTLFSAGVHALSSATFGGFLGHALLTRRKWQRVGLTLAGLLLAAALHGAWNAALLLAGAYAADGGLQPWLAVVPALYVVYILILAAFLRSEHGILKRQLGEEVELDLAPAWVAEIIPYYRRRLRSDWWPVRDERTVISRLLTRIAFRKHALRHLPQNEASIASLEVVHLRQRIRRILAPPDTNGD